MTTASRTTARPIDPIDGHTTSPWLVRTLLATLLAALALAPSAFAGPEAAATAAARKPSGPPPTLTVTMEGDDGPLTWSFTPAGEAVSPLGERRGWQLAASELPRDLVLFGGRARIEIRHLEFDHNPFIDFNVAVTNLLPTTETFTFTATVLTTFAAPNFISGNIETTVTDENGDGATLAALAADSVYSGQIDGVTVATLQDFPFTLVAPVDGTDGASDSFGPDPNAIPVTTSIAARVRFELSPGDSATASGRFEVVGTADLDVLKEGVVSGDQIIYTLTVLNNGPDEATNVVVTDALPPELTYLSDDCGGSDLPPWTWTIPTLANGASEVCNITTELDPSFSGELSNTATATSDQVDPEPGNDADTIRITGLGPTLLEIPTLGTTAAALLALLLAGAAVVALRRGG